MLNRTSRIQLLVFAVVTVLTVGAIMLFYLRVPAKLGVGVYHGHGQLRGRRRIVRERQCHLPRRASRTRRGRWTLTDDGVAAHMRLNSDIKIPANSTATVKSVFCGRRTIP